MGHSLGCKIDKDAGHSLVQIKGCEEEGNEVMKRGRTAYH